MLTASPHPTLPEEILLSLPIGGPGHTSNTTEMKDINTRAYDICPNSGYAVLSEQVRILPNLSKILPTEIGNQGTFLMTVKEILSEIESPRCRLDVLTISQIVTSFLQEGILRINSDGGLLQIMGIG